MVGEALEPFRDQVKIATKFGANIDPDTGKHLGRFNIDLSAFEKSRASTSKKAGELNTIRLSPNGDDR